MVDFTSNAPSFVADGVEATPHAPITPKALAQRERIATRAAPRDPALTKDQVIKLIHQNSSGGGGSSAGSVALIAGALDVAVLNSANSHSDGRDGVTLLAANNYADGQDTAVLLAAKNYSDSTTLVNAKGYTDSELDLYPIKHPDKMGGYHRTTAGRMLGYGSTGHYGGYSSAGVNGDMSGLSTNIDSGWVSKLSSPATLDLAFPKFVSFGDSIAYNSLHPLIGQPVVVNMTGLTTVNLGVPGERLDQIALRVDTMLAEKNVHILYLSMGSNDVLQGVSLDVMKSSTRAIFDRLQESTAGNIVMTGMNPMEPIANGAAVSDAMRLKGKQYNDWCAKVAAHYGILFIDGMKLWAEDYDNGDYTWKNPAQMTQDNLHPNANGYISLWAYACQIHGLPMFPQSITMHHFTNLTVPPTNPIPASVAAPAKMEILWNSGLTKRYLNRAYGASLYTNYEIPADLTEGGDHLAFLVLGSNTRGIRIKPITSVGTAYTAINGVTVHYGSRPQCNSVRVDNLARTAVAGISSQHIPTTTARAVDTPVTVQVVNDDPTLFTITAGGIKVSQDGVYTLDLQLPISNFGTGANILYLTIGIGVDSVVVASQTLTIGNGLPDNTSGYTHLSSTLTLAAGQTIKPLLSHVGTAVSDSFEVGSNIVSSIFPGYSAFRLSVLTATRIEAVR